ncbi:hypothetical protein N0V90_006168 [Kalmusia sp. IMI 367209]|nr:hypothetical protein N0V90_006168 [Kalmusia sp. IMI 367209]
MAPQPPQTLSVKRKRNDPPVQHLIVDAEHTVKRQKSETFEKNETRFTWRLLEKPGADVPLAPPTPAQQNRRFHIALSAGQRVLIETPHPVNGAQVAASETQNVSSTIKTKEPEVAKDLAPAAPATPPRKRPGAASAVRPRPAATAKKDVGPKPDEQVQQFEQFSKEVEREDLGINKPPSSPLKYLPKGPVKRFKDRFPQQAAKLAVQDPDAMDVDDYVYDTYVREEIMRDANGKVPKSTGTVGIIVLKEEDEEWWNGDDDSDREYATDEEDENAEDYYANDYPEDELSSDDEFNRDPYQSRYRHGSDDEEFDLNDDEGTFSGDEDDEHFRRMIGPGQAGLLKRLGH